MKIFSTFNTEFKREVVEREKKKYWNDKVVVISHWKIYYYFAVILPAIFILILAILYLTLMICIWWKIDTNLKVIYYIVGLLIFLGLFIPFMLKVIKNYIDYILDFIVITPNELIYYDQEWILSRRWRTLDAEKIKTITVNKSGLMRSIFNFGNIVVLSEWDELWQGEVNFSFVDNPEVIRIKIFEVINKKK